MLTEENVTKCSRMVTVTRNKKLIYQNVVLSHC